MGLCEKDYLGKCGISLHLWVNILNKQIVYFYELTVTEIQHESKEQPWRVYGGYLIFIKDIRL